MKSKLVLAHSSPDSPAMYRLNIPHTVQTTYTHTIYTVVKPSARVCPVMGFIKTSRPLH